MLEAERPRWLLSSLHLSRVDPLASCYMVGIFTEDRH